MKKSKTVKNVSIPDFLLNDKNQWAVIKQQFTYIMLSNSHINLSTDTDRKAYQMGLQLNRNDLLRRYENQFITKEPSSLVLNNSVEDLIKMFRGYNIKMPKEKILGIEEMYKTLPQDIKVIQDSLQNETLSLTFLTSWARFRMADTILQFLLDNIAPNQFNQANQGTGIDSNQYWYLLWVEYLLTHKFCSEIRSAYPLIGKIVYDLVTDPQKLPDNYDREWMVGWLKKMLSKKANKEIRDVLTSGFSVKQLSNQKFETNLAEARKWAKYLPPVGFENYIRLNLPTPRVSELS